MLSAANELVTLFSSQVIPVARQTGRTPVSTGEQRTLTAVSLSFKQNEFLRSSVQIIVQTIISKALRSPGFSPASVQVLVTFVLCFSMVRFHTSGLLPIPALVSCSARRHQSPVRLMCAGGSCSRDAESVTFQSRALSWGAVVETGEPGYKGHMNHKFQKILG